MIQDLLIRWKLQLMLVGAVILGVLGMRAKWISDGQTRMRQKISDRNLRAVKDAQEVRDEVEALDPATLQRRAARWVRNTDR